MDKVVSTVDSTEKLFEFSQLWVERRQSLELSPPQQQCCSSLGRTDGEYSGTGVTLVSTAAAIAQL